MTRRKRDREEQEDDRPPICPACGVTQGMVMSDDDETRFVCLECGFADEQSMNSRPQP
jgi:Zn ribbon nucleic-acid-binding protein